MSCTSLTIEKLIETLVTAKTTGTDKPGKSLSYLSTFK